MTWATTRRWLLPAITLSLAVSYFAWWMTPSLGDEDGWFETAGALCLLAASGLFLAQYLKSRKGNDLLVLRTKRNLFLLLLALMFFFGFAEEISWGQRMFKFPTPASMQKANLQGEANLHNLTLFHGLNAAGKKKTALELMLNFDRLFALFWISFCILIPLGYKFSPWASRWLEKINLPIVPLELGVLLLVNHALAEVIKHSAASRPFLIEIKEYNAEAIFLVIAVALWVREAERTDEG
jgi:hypothetical protein